MNLIFAVMVFAVMAMQPKCANSAEVAEVRYPVEVISCHDADTCLVRGIPFPAPMSDTIALRIADINAPEVSRSSCSTAAGRAHETRLGRDAAVYVRELTARRRGVVAFRGLDDFSRALGRLIIFDGDTEIDVGDRLIDVGYAVPYYGKGAKPAPFCG